MYIYIFIYINKTKQKQIIVKPKVHYSFHSELKKIYIEKY